MLEYNTYQDHTHARSYVYVINHYLIRPDYKNMYFMDTINVTKFKQMSLVLPQRLWMLNIQISFRILRDLNCTKYLI